MRKRTKFLFYLAIGMIIFPMVYLATATPSQAAGNCTSWDGKDESEPFSITAPTGYVITSITIKSGDDCFTYTTNGDKETDANGDACYSISGIGTQTGSAEKVGVGAGQVCQDISHIEVSWEMLATDTPTATLADTATNTPTNTPEDTPTNTPTATEEEQDTPTPTATEEEQDTPTPTATEEEQDTPTPTEEVRDTPTATDPGDPGSTPTPTGEPRTHVCNAEGEIVHPLVSDAWRYNGSPYKVVKTEDGVECVYDPPTAGGPDQVMIAATFGIMTLGLGLMGYVGYDFLKTRQAV
jgi:hypothetical protein